jgi:hypothetical protein
VALRDPAVEGLLVDRDERADAGEVVRFGFVTRLVA